MHLVQLILPIADEHGRPFGRAPFDLVRAELTERYGGVTAYMRSPAAGLWKTAEGAVARDDVVIVEVMVPELDRAAWDRYRRELEARFHQDQVVIRAMAIETL